MKPKRIATPSLLLALCLGCSGLRPASSAQHDSISFIVAASTDLRPISKVELILITKDGSVENIGLTDELGSATVPKRKLRSSRCLLFCRDGFFCGAFQLYKKEAEFLRYDELFITLSPFSLR
jgi:hypothetical protein